MAVTGALHEDGLADTVDGFGGGGDRDRKLQIMRDSRIGTYGVVALVLVLGARVVALASFEDNADAIAALILCQAASRALVVAVMQRAPLARSDGLAASAGRPTQATMLWALGLAGIIAVALAYFDGVVAMVVGAVVAWAITWLARRQIGGVTGDVLGAVQQGSADRHAARPRRARLTAHDRNGDPLVVGPARAGDRPWRPHLRAGGLSGRPFGHRHLRCLGRSIASRTRYG